MRLQLTLTQLTYIVAVDTYRHFAKAAESCFVSQPTLSMQIQKLEDELNIIIFDRSKQPIVPTDIGKKIIAQARTIIHESQRVHDIISTETGDVSGELKIGIIPTVAPFLLPIFLLNFIKKYPKVEVTISELQTNQIIDKLHKDIIDLGILATPLNEQGIIEKPLYYEEFIAYIPDNHRLKDKHELSIDDLSINDILLLDEGNCFREQSLQLCQKLKSKKNESEPLIHFESGNLETLKKLVDQNFGMTLLPELMVKDTDSKTDPKKLKVFSEPKPKREISIIYSRSYLKKQLIKAVEETIIESIPSEMLTNTNIKILDVKSSSQKN
jgi:LysR family transcriptional regulator, hydrogen peroxide-inducible genes activator